MTKTNPSNLKSELRQDPVSGDWIIIAPGRGGRPQTAHAVSTRKKTPKKLCPFEDPQKAGNKDPILTYPDRDKWQIQVLENKYPAVIHSDTCGVPHKTGPFSTLPANGHHDLIITKDHDKNFPKLSRAEANQVIQVMRDRYLMLYKHPCLEYILAMHNWGPRAGASVYHPHYQMIALPVIPPDVNHSLKGSKRYYDEHKKCVHCEMIKWETKEGTRVIFENDGAIAFAPFVSRSAFEIRIFPKKHQSYFENVYDADIAAAVEALQFVLGKMEKRLNDPDYNFFIHTAPLQNKEQYEHYHWHIEIIPRLAIRASFELGTGVEVNDVDPDQAAKLLRR